MKDVCTVQNVTQPLFLFSAGFFAMMCTNRKGNVVLRLLQVKMLCWICFSVNYSNFASVNENLVALNNQRCWESSIFQLDREPRKTLLTLGHCFPWGKGYSCCFCCGKSLVWFDSSRVIVITYFAIIFMVLLFRALASKQKLGSWFLTFWTFLTLFQRCCNSWHW